MDEIILDKWAVETGAQTTSVILPDGCCDVILSKSDGQAPQVKLSALMHAPLAMRSDDIQQMTGYRLHPATRVDTSALAGVLKNAEPEDDCSDAINSVCTRNAALAEVLDCLQTGPINIDSAAKLLGVRTRTMQRLFAANDLPSPVFWLQLARARRAGRDIILGKNLGDIAYDTGFADQAHMSRTIRALFGVTPTQLRKRDDLTWQLFQSGFATGEQISTKMPSMSLT